MLIDVVGLVNDFLICINLLGYRGIFDVDAILHKFLRPACYLLGSGTIKGFVFFNYG